MTLEKLPPVLVLHLKRFVYERNGGCRKLAKDIDYPVDLEISRGEARGRLLQLTAVVVHELGHLSRPARGGFCLPWGQALCFTRDSPWFGTGSGRCRLSVAGRKSCGRKRLLELGLGCWDPRVPGKEARGEKPCHFLSLAHTRTVPE